MASSDWTYASDILASGAVRRGVTNGIARPNGGGNFVFGLNSITNAPGVVSLYSAQANFSPMAKGGSIRGCLQRGPGGGLTKNAPFLIIGQQATSVNSLAYMLGLQDDDPSHIVLRKGLISEGLPAGTPGTAGGIAAGLLRRSTGPVEVGDWVHLRLDMIFNTNGDVILKAFMSDLVANPCTAPSWVAIPGIADYVDDALGVNSGSVPLTSGRVGFGMHTSDVTRRAYFDQMEVFRQL